MQNPTIFESLSDSPKFLITPYDGSNGFYAAVSPLPNTLAFIMALIERLHLGEKIYPSMVHLTQMYSKARCRANVNPAVFKCRAKEIVYWKDSKSLVLLVESDQLQKEHQRLTQHGARHSFPDYCPHISLYHGVLPMQTHWAIGYLNVKLTRRNYILSLANQVFSNLN